jgi:apolipoprotein N-acyltransferase
MKRKPVLAIYFGALLWALAYPPLPFGFLIFLAWIPMAWGTENLSPKQAFLHHFLAGLLYNTLMYWWIYNVIAVGPGIAIGGGLLLLIAFLSLFNGFLGWAYRCCLFFPYGRLAFPFLWAGFEVARAYGQMSFPWNNLGYALGSYLPLIQLARSIGVYGLSFLIISANLLGVYALLKAGRQRWVALGLALTIPVGLGADGWWRLRSPTPASPALEIALVQPSIPQTKKWGEAYFLDVMQKTFDVMDHPSRALQGAQLVVLPETAIPDFLRTRHELIQGFIQRSHDLKVPIILGALDFQNDPKPWREYQFYNAAFLFKPTTDTLYQYNKLRLVPFSEKLPFDNIFPVINYVNLGEGDFSQGFGHVIWGGDTAYSPSICYEVIYPGHFREARHAGAKFLINITNDGWFGRSSAPYQHANIARFRVIEVGAPMARAANTGISLFYDYRGRTLAQTKLMASTVLKQSVPRQTEDTFYLRHGDWMEALELGLFILIAILCAWSAWKKRPSSKPSPL